MRVLLSFLLGVVVGLGGYWFVQQNQHRDPVQTAGEQISTGARKAKEAIQDTIGEISAEKIKEELARTSTVVREKAKSAGAAISDAAANARITATIKAKFIKEPGVSALNINVDTTDGVVTLSGRANSHEEIAKAVNLALETEGVTKVISTIQIKAAK